MRMLAARFTRRLTLSRVMFLTKLIQRLHAQLNLDADILLEFREWAPGVSDAQRLADERRARGLFGTISDTVSRSGTPS
jgi:hypothetical protein